jgi:hypothetical protein
MKIRPLPYEKPQVWSIGSKCFTKCVCGVCAHISFAFTYGKTT